MSNRSHAIGNKPNRFIKFYSKRTTINIRAESNTIRTNGKMTIKYVVSKARESKTYSTNVLADRCTTIVSNTKSIGNI